MTLTEKQEEYLQDVPKELWAEGGHDIGLMRSAGQYELYCEMGSTFQLCKICTERDKDTKIQPCGHLLCRPCLMGWQKSDGHTCPYCRCDIRGAESIVIEPFTADRERKTGLQDEEVHLEEEEDDDLEDVELVMKELASMKMLAAENQGSPASPAPLPLPPKHTSSPCNSPRPPIRPSVSEILSKYSHSRPAHGNSHGQTDRQLHRQSATTSSEEAGAGSSRPSSSQAARDGGALWSTPSALGRDGQTDTAGRPQRDRHSWREMERSMTS
ncbi:hypothetical protein SKAU_G00075590 [Synaphobranchus kaupii]|uniref:E3 ubiquitin-protein ligase CBL n=1 Tax=Synaphobranchus kaupii TaxID=118154 RepID=A0A9Q1J9Y6_SYNKA|nr:hypothetical protein SKAU_G00075590 [Synaphobranchus kaupii]